ncbi:MFS transporter [Actinopolyspora erythraea]|uniref:MFS transporter n=1 Tax=Actinopolyspora erythraea TaxID=414996 RepID=A0A099D0P3_9ACTN|nr:MFS transporter [Actinopolyspora erythraea]ASU79706.1 MFS transporter [Actinopolyspora erythraea]KGI79574.1 MFS transporter permease [Actinopolyspora erythraea]
MPDPQPTTAETPDDQLKGGKSALAELPREIWVLISGGFIVAIGMGIVSPALPTFATSFNVGVTAAAFIVSAFALMRLVFAPASGRLVSAFGERPNYVLGIVIVGISSTACAFAQSYWQLLVFRGLGGIGSTMFTVSALALLVRLSPAHLRARASGLWATSFLLGSISGPVLGGLLIGFSLRLPFLIYGIALYLAAFVGWFLLRDSTLADPQQHADAPDLRVTTALRDPSYRASLLANFSKGWTAQGVRIALIPLFISQALGLPDAMTGVALSVFAAGNAAVLLPAGRLADSRGRKPMLLVGLAVAAVGSAAIGFSESVPWLLGASLLGGIGMGLFTPAQSAAVADIVGPKAKGGPVLAAFQMSADVGTVIGPPLAGALAGALSYRAAFLLTGLVALVAMVMWLFSPETLGRDSRSGRTESAERGAAD